jgi:hypothetical protein
VSNAWPERGASTVKRKIIFEPLPLNSYFFFLGLFQIFKEMIYHSFNEFITIDCKFKCFSFWNRKWIRISNESENLFSMLLIKDSVYNTLNILGEKDTAAFGLLQRMKGYSFIASVYVLRSVLPILSSLSKVFQSGTIDFSHICPSLQFTIDKLKEIADNQTPIVELKKDLSEGGRLSELQLNATENQIEKTSSMLRKYTESLISNIEKRFSDSLEILKALQDLLQNFLGWTQLYWRFRIMFF